MKTTLLILVFSLSMFSVCNSQQLKAPKNSNVITITKAGDAKEVFIEFGMFLRDYGYSLENVDKDFLSLSTGYKEFKASGAGELKIKSYTQQTDKHVEIVIRGTLKMANPFGSPVSFEACNCGMAGDNRKKAFNTIIKLVEKYECDKIEFSKE